MTPTTNNVEPTTSATDKLRAMLNERGVEYEARTSPTGGIWTYWDAFNGHRVYARDNENGTVKIFGEWDVTPEQAIAATLGPRITGETSDGFHTFNELYHHRAVLFSVIVRDHRELAWKSKLHHDGTMYDGMFIVGIETPNGQATYHYAIDPYWEMFDCKELERAPEWDGHSPDDAIERISTLGSFTVQATERTAKDSEKGSDGHGECRRVLYKPTGVLVCSECGAGIPKQIDKYCYLHYCPNCGRKLVDE